MITKKNETNIEIKPGIHATPIELSNSEEMNHQKITEPVRIAHILKPVSRKIEIKQTLYSYCEDLEKLVRYATDEDSRDTLSTLNKQWRLRLLPKSAQRTPLYFLRTEEEDKCLAWSIKNILKQMSILKSEWKKLVGDFDDE